MTLPHSQRPPLPEPAPPKLVLPPRRSPVRALDWIMLVLALVSVGLLSWEFWGHPTPEQTRAIIYADYVLCGIFAAEFLLRWRQADWHRSFLGRNWYEILGMIPVAHPALRGFRLIRVVILLGRLGRAGDRAFGREFTYHLVNGVKTKLVEAISGAVTVAVLKEVTVVLQKGHYSRNIGRALAENHTELRQMLLDKLADDPQLARLKRLPFYGDISETVIEGALRVVAEVLNDPRTDEFIADLLRENLEQIGQAVRANQAPPSIKATD